MTPIRIITSNNYFSFVLDYLIIVCILCPLQASFFSGAQSVMKAHFEVMAELGGSVPAFQVRRHLGLRRIVRTLESEMESLAAPAGGQTFSSHAKQAVRESPERLERALASLHAIVSGNETATDWSARAEDDWRDIARVADREGSLPLLAKALGNPLPVGLQWNPFANVLRNASRQAGSRGLVLPW